MIPISGQSIQGPYGYIGYTASDFAISSNDFPIIGFEVRAGPGVFGLDLSYNAS